MSKNKLILAGVIVSAMLSTTMATGAYAYGSQAFHGPCAWSDTRTFINPAAQADIYRANESNKEQVCVDSIKQCMRDVQAYRALMPPCQGIRFQHTCEYYTSRVSNGTGGFNVTYCSAESYARAQSELGI